MRCSWFESRLDRYAEGTLPARRMIEMSAHLERCVSCSALLAELRVVDALLLTTSPVELAPNFTFALMAEVREQRVPQARAHAFWPALAMYLVATWVVICGGLAALGNRISFARSAFAPVRESLAHGGSAIAGAAHALGPATPAVVGIVGGVLAIDVVLVAAIVVFYSLVRPRLSARLTRQEAS